MKQVKETYSYVEEEGLTDTSLVEKKDKLLLQRDARFINIVDIIDKHQDYVDKDPIFNNQLSHGMIDRALVEAFNEYGRDTWTGADLARVVLTPRPFQPYLLEVKRKT